jgi:hypothetical protein
LPATPGDDLRAFRAVFDRDRSERRCPVGLRVRTVIPASVSLTSRRSNPIGVVPSSKRRLPILYVLLGATWRLHHPVEREEGRDGELQRFTPFPAKRTPLDLPERRMVSIRE